MDFQIALQFGRQGVSYEPAIVDKPGEALVRSAGESSKKVGLHSTFFFFFLKCKKWCSDLNLFLSHIE